MTNDLKNFLEGERKDTINSLFYSDPDLPLVEQIIQDHDTGLINFVLDLVEKEVEKGLEPPTEWTETVKLYHNREDYCTVCGFNPNTEKHHISTIINNLRV